MGRLLDATPEAELARLFSAEELSEAGNGPRRAARLAARFAAKEACLKLFPRETALETLAANDFSVSRDNYGAPWVTCSETAAFVLRRYRLDRIELSMAHDRTSAWAVALTVPMTTKVSLWGRILYRLLPIRRAVILENLRRAYGDRVPEAEIERLAAAHYAHLWRLMLEILSYPLIPRAKRLKLVRVENLDAIARARDEGKGVIVLSGHFGNFEVSTTAGIASFPGLEEHFYFLRRPIKPQWLDAYVTRRFRKAGFGVLPPRGSLDWLLGRLADGDLVVFPFDQYAVGRDGIPVEFFGHSARTLRSLALIAQASGAPVVPTASWREPNGKHVLHFDEALPYIECADFDEEVRRNTRAYNAALERLIVRHPEQWWWVHQRWKPKRDRRSKVKT